MIKPILLLLVALVTLSGCVFESFEEPGIFFPGDNGGDVGMDAEIEDGGSQTDDMGPPDMSVADMSGGDMSMTTDAGSDMSDAEVDMFMCSDTVEPIPDSFGETCTAPNGTTPAQCDPVAQTGCQAGERCALQLLLSNGVPSGFSATCVGYDCSFSTKGRNEPCFAGQCGPGYLCNQGVCRRYCELADSRGCEMGEFCVGSSIARTYGLCRADCF